MEVDPRLACSKHFLVFYHLAPFSPSSCTIMPFSVELHLSYLMWLGQRVGVQRHQPSLVSGVGSWLGSDPTVFQSPGYDDWFWHGSDTGQAGAEISLKYNCWLLAGIRSCKCRLKAASGCLYRMQWCIGRSRAFETVSEICLKSDAPLDFPGTWALLVWSISIFFFFFLPRVTLVKCCMIGHSRMENTVGISGF